MPVMSDLVVVLAVGVALLGTIYLIGRWILGPIDRAAEERKRRVRFSLGDFLCLFVVVQLPLSLVAKLQSEETAFYFWLCSILAWVVAPVIWIACAATLSRAGLARGRHRMIFMGLVLPVTYYGIMPFVLLLAYFAGLSLSDEFRLLAIPWWLLPAWTATGIAIVGCGFYTNWLARQHTLFEPASEDNAHSAT